MLRSFNDRLNAVGQFFQPVLLLALRLFLGDSIKTGLGKLQNISEIAHFFESLNLLPTANAYVVGTIEIVAGTLLLVGLASRFAALLLSVIMTMALATAHKAALANIFSDPLNLIVQLPFPFLLALLVIFAFGAGLFSLDALTNPETPRRRK